jgi:predicted transcriptional regulator
MVLAANGTGVSKTRIMFNAYLSYDQLNEYINELLDKEHLAYDLHTRTYHKLLKEANSWNCTLNSKM